MSKSLAIAYSMKKKAKKADMCAHGGPTECNEGCYADGGDIKGVHRPNKYPMGGAKGESDTGDNVRWEMAHRLSGNQSAADREMSKAKDKHQRVLGEMKSMKKPELMAEGGFIGSHQSESAHPDIDGGDVNEMGSGYVGHDSAAMDADYPGHRFNQMGESDEGAGGGNEVPPIVMKIMMGRAKGYSKGGMAANQDEPVADFMPNEFDDLHLDDKLEGHIKSNQEHGDEQEDEDRKDIVSKIMASRRKKDRNPVPA